MGKTKKTSKIFLKNKLGTVLKDRQKTKNAKDKFKGTRGTRALDQAGQLQEKKDADPDADSGDEGPSMHDDFAIGDGMGSASDSEDDAAAAAGSDHDLSEDDDDAAAGSDSDDGADDSTDDDDDVAVGPNGAARDEVAELHGTMQRLAEKDPEFFKYLQDNNRELLEFGEDESDDDDDDDHDAAMNDDDSEEEDGYRPHDDDGASAVTKGKQVTLQMVKAWKRKVIEEKSFGSLKDLLTAFRAACHVGSDDDGFQCRYSVQDGRVFDLIMSVCLNNMTDAFDNFIPVKTKEGSVTPLPTTSNKWSKLKTCVKSYNANLLTFVKQLTDAKMIGVVLRSIEKHVRYFACFPRLVRNLLKVAVNIVSTGEDIARPSAYLVVRELAIVVPYPFLDTCLKALYMSYVRVAKFVSPQTLPHLTFMENCIVELYGLDHKCAYQHTFAYIRQLAIHLRNAITMKRKDGFQQVYNWQYVRCLIVWAKVLGAHAGTDMHSGVLSPLVYPLVQVILGTIRLVPSDRFIPLRCVLCKTLNQLCDDTQLYIPLSAILVDVVKSVAAALYKAKSSALKKVDFDSTLKTPKQLEQSRQHLEGLLDRGLALLLEHLSINAYSIAFPELALPTVQMLKKVIKTTRDIKSKKLIKGIVVKVQENIVFIQARRSAVAFSPRDFGKIAQWMRSEAADNKSPLRLYADQWKRLETQRQDRIKQHVENARQRQQDDHAGEGSDSDAADDDHTNELMASDDDSDSDSDDDSDDAAPVKGKGKSGKAGKVKGVRSKYADMDDGDLPEDAVEDFDMSDDE